MTICPSGHLSRPAPRAGSRVRSVTKAALQGCYSRRPPTYSCGDSIPALCPGRPGQSPGSPRHIPPGRGISSLALVPPSPGPAALCPRSLQRAQGGSLLLWAFWPHEQRSSRRIRASTFPPGAAGVPRAPAVLGAALRPLLPAAVPGKPGLPDPLMARASCSAPGRPQLDHGPAGISEHRVGFLTELAGRGRSQRLVWLGLPRILAQDFQIYVQTFYRAEGSAKLAFKTVSF